jgi:hypothetical protein
MKGRGKRGGQTWEDRKEKHGLGDNGEGDSKKKAKEEEEELLGTCSGVSVKHTRGSMRSNADSGRGRKWRLCMHNKRLNTHTPIHVYAVYIIVFVTVLAARLGKLLKPI